MKRFLLTLGAVLTVGLGAAFATTTDELMLSNTAGTITATISDNGGCVGTGGGCTGLNHIGSVYDTNPADGAIFVSGTITLADGTWEINDTTGTSHSPGVTPFGIDVGSLTAFCEANCSGGSVLDIYYSDQNFTSTATGFTTFYSATDEGGGSTTQNAWVSTANTIFGEGSLIGTVGPITGTGGSGTASGGVAAGPAQYSLTLEDIFQAPANNGATQATSFSVDGNITATPEPTSIVLLGTILLGAGALLRRRTA